MSTLPNTPQPLNTKTTESMSSAGHMTGSLPDGQDREQKVNNSALPRGLIPVSVGTESPNGNSASSELYTTTQLHSQFPSPSAIHGQPPIRAQSLLARKRIQKACNPPDLASDGETEQGPRKRARTELQVDKEEQFCIGYHINEPRLPIFASLGVSNKLYVHALKEQTPIDVLERWDLLVTNGSQVALEKTVLDRDIFPLSLGNLENLDRKKVAGLIKESIEAKRDGRQMKVEGVSTSQEKHVGFHKDDHEVPVYARMQLKTSGISYPTFNAHKSDAEKSTVDFKNRLVSYKDIRYIGKYARENLEESRKAIQEDLSTVSQSEVPTVAAQSQPSKILKISLGKQDRGVETTGLDNGIGEDQALRDLSRNNRPVQGRRDTLVYHAEKVVDSFNEFVEAVSSQEKLAFQAQAKVERLQKANKEQAQEIADLKATISRLQVQTVNQHTSRTVLPAQEIDIEPDRFETIPPEVDNGGMLREQKARPVEVGGKEYEERIFLLECKLQVSGHLTGETVKHDGVSFTQIMEGNVEKLVQNLGPSSLVQCDGRQFLRWVTLKEKRFYGI